MKRNTLYLVGLIVVLILVAYLVMKKPGEQSSSGAGELLVQIDSLAVDKLDIKSPSSHVVLEKQGAEWYVKEPVNYKADQANVGTLVHYAKNLEVKNIVSSRPEKHAVFQVDSASGTHFTIYERGTLKTSLIIGKIGSTYTELYVRKLPSNDVQAVDASIYYQFNRSVKDWRDKGIVTMPKESIKVIKYQYGDTTFTMEFKDSVWMIGKDLAKAEDVTSILNALSSFQTDDFIDSAVTPAPKINAQVSYAEVQLRFSFMKTANKYYLQSSSSNQWFVVEPSKANSILKRKKELIKK